MVPAPIPRRGERQAARYGQLEQATPAFTQGRQLPLAGLLLALPGFDTTGLLHIAETTCGRLRNGLDGLRSMLMAPVLLALLHEPRAEGATRVVPADLGRILTLDRAPEVSNIRRRLGELAERGQAGQLMQSLAHHHVTTHQDAVGFLYIDGHVRAYHGTRRLPQTLVNRMCVAMPATLETRCRRQRKPDLRGHGPTLSLHRRRDPPTTAPGTASTGRRGPVYHDRVRRDAIPAQPPMQRLAAPP